MHNIPSEQTLASIMDKKLKTVLGGHSRIPLKFNNIEFNRHETTVDVDVTIEVTLATDLTKGWSEVALYFWLTSASADFESGQPIKNDQIARLFLCF